MDSFSSLNEMHTKDTVSKKSEDDKVDRGEHSTMDTPLGFNPMIHHCIPVFSRQYLWVADNHISTLGSSISSYGGQADAFTP